MHQLLQRAGIFHLFRKGGFVMGVAEIAAEVNAKLDAVRATLAREVTGKGDVCLTCSFQAEDVLLTKLAIALDPRIPILFLDTGYHFAETYAYRDRIAREWDLNLINLLPEKTVAEQEAEHRLALSIRARPLLRPAQSRTAVQGGGRISRVAHRPAPRAGEEPRGAGRVGAVFAARRQAGAEAGAAGGVDHARRVVRVRAAWDSAAAALRARLHLDWLRAMHLAAARSQRSALGPLGRTQSGVRHSHSGGAGEVDTEDRTTEGQEMQYVIGFFIALFIALTGVGAGTITVPVLVLFLGVPAPVAVGIGLMFSAAVKLILVPAQIARRNVAWRTLGYMLLGGAPGVLVGSLFLKHLVSAGSANLLNAILGAILVTTASWQIFFRSAPWKTTAIRATAARCSRGSCFRWARRWAFHPREQARWAAPHC